MPDYTWICHACSKPNRPAADHCSACGFPAVASGPAITERITGITKPLRPSPRQHRQVERQAVAALRPGPRLLANLLRGSRFLGPVIFCLAVLAGDWAGIALGLCTTAAGELLLGRLLDHGREPASGRIAG